MLSLAPLLSLLAAVLLTAPAVRGATCNIDNPCPSTSPCCSQYGFCGTGYYCLGGCNPLGSHSLDSCLPSPVCENANYALSDTSRILTNSTHYNGDASEYDWVVEQGNILKTTSDGEDAIALTLTQQGGGTLVSSTRFIHYGQVTARMKTGRWAGVVAAFITMSNIRDEIDWEFPGNHVTEGQTNYFWQGVIAQPTNGETETGFTDTYANWHDYTINWQPDSMTFLVDGVVTRTILASDTINPQTGVFEFPNTPSRIQLSIWAAGVPSQAKGTINWAGGMVNWNDPDYTSAGHFATLFQSVSVQCNDSPTPSGVTSYVYGTNSSTDTPSISFSTASTMLNGAQAQSDTNSARAQGNVLDSLGNLL